MSVLSIEGRSLVAGRGQGSLLHADLGLSFWGGVDPFSGEVIDRHHPLSGQSLAGRVLAIPSGRGSCTGSSVLLELILNGPAPAALVLAEPDEILTLGALVGMALIALWRGETRHLTPPTQGMPWGKLVLAAFVGQFLAMVLWLAGYKYTLASVAAILNETASVFILLLAWVWLKEPLTRRALAGVGLTLAGVSCMLWVR